MSEIAHLNRLLDEQVLRIDAAQGRRVLDAVYEFIGRFVSYPSEPARVAHALWIIHAHVLEQCHTSPRLGFMSAEKESGKSRALEITQQLVPGGVLSVSISPAALVRRVAAGGVTVLYDEVDALFGSVAREEANLDVRSILNSGYRRGAKVHRCVTVGKRVEVEELDAFAPVAVAGLRNLPDTLASRTIIIRMRRRAPDEVVEQFRFRRVLPLASALYDRIAAWTGGLDLREAEPAMPDGVEDRSAECWEPLLAVADAAGGDWPRRVREAAVHFVAGGRDESTSPGVELLEHIREAFATVDALWTETLLERLHARPESPWRDIRGKPLDDRGLARRLKGFGIRSRDVRVGGGGARKGYRTEQFHDAWKRYLTVSATSATSATKLINKNNIVADVADVAAKSATAGDMPEPQKPAPASIISRSGIMPPADDWPELPACLRRTPAKPVVVRPNAPALGPPGDSLDDF
jgi:Protein of unknown function (DUF3631)